MKNNITLTNSPHRQAILRLEKFTSYGIWGFAVCGGFQIYIIMTKQYVNVQNKSKASVKTYSEKLRNPKWQRLRLEVMERDKFTCRSCGDSEKTLNVHHMVSYRKDTEPWDYETWELITLCEDCHKTLTDDLNEMKSIITEQCPTPTYSHELLKILKALEGCNPFQLTAAWQLMQIGIHGGLFKSDTYYDYVNNHG